MFRFLNCRALFRTFAFLAVAGLAIGPSYLIPHYLGRGAEPVPSVVAAAGQAQPVSDLEDAFRLERSGDLEAAFKKYRAAQKEKAVSVREFAARGAERVGGKIEELYPHYEDLRGVYTISVRSRPFFAGALAVGLLLAVLHGTYPRRGMALRPFPVAPRLDEDTAAAFNRSLSDEIDRVRRAYTSAQFARMGVKVVAPDLVGDAEADDIWTRALSSLREGGLKTATRFSMGELINLFRDFGRRPEYVLSGSVVVTPDGARARARLTRHQGGPDIAVWEADSSEAGLGAMGVAEPPPLPTASTQGGGAAGEKGDFREDAAALTDVAAVLACKVWHGLARGSSMDKRPASWQTVFLFVRALTALERFQ